MSLLVYNARQGYLATDKRFQYLNKFYHLDIANKLYINKDKTIAYGCVGRLLTINQFEIFDIIFKNWYYSEKTDNDTIEMKNDYNKLIKNSNKNMSLCLCIITSDEGFIISAPTPDEMEINELDLNLDIVEGNGEPAARVALIAGIDNPKDIFRITYLSNNEVSEDYDIVYRHKLKQLKNSRIIKHG